MAQQFDSGYYPATADAAVAQWARVKLESDGKVVEAGITELGIGIAQEAAFASGDIIKVKLWSAQGTLVCLVSEAITAGADVYTAANGKMSGSSGGGARKVAVALTASTADGDVIECSFAIDSGVGGGDLSATDIDSLAEISAIILDANLLDEAGASTIVTVGTVTTGTWNADVIAHEYGGLEGDFSAGDGFVQIKAGATTVVKSNTAAAVAPGATDDSAAGYAVGSVWIDTTADKSYTCVDATATSAVWVEQGGGGLTQEEIDTIAELNSVVTDATLLVSGGDLGTPSAIVLTNASGTAASLTAGTVTTNANLTGHVTSTGNAAVLGSFTTAQLNTAISDGTINTPEGTAVLSTGEVGGTKFLREDGDGTCSWQTVAGGGNEFADNVFRVQDDGDATKEIALQASAITTGTTRTITMPDQDVDLTPGTGTFATAAEGDLAATALQTTSIDTLAELNAILTDATLIDGALNKSGSGTFTESADGSNVGGDTTVPADSIIASGEGALAIGKTIGSTHSGTITASGAGSFAGGHIDDI